MYIEYNGHLITHFSSSEKYWWWRRQATATVISSHFFSKSPFLTSFLPAIRTYNVRVDGPKKINCWCPKAIFVQLGEIIFGYTKHIFTLTISASLWKKKLAYIFLADCEKWHRNHSEKWSEKSNFLLFPQKLEQVLERGVSTSIA